ncbi:MAG: hypothetical protein J0M08_03385 [Bacteroidetes bacterium]|nr:hypothetical protein [Bacteroidota bacterium]
MKTKTALIYIALLFMGLNINHLRAQIKQSSVLVYNIDYASKPVVHTAVLTSVKPIIINWSTQNEYNDKGVYVVSEKAQKEALNHTFELPFPQSGDVNCYDFLPGYMVSKNIYTLIKAGSEADIREGCNMLTDKLKPTGNIKTSIKIAGKAKDVPVITCTYNTFGDELWILDNPDFPVVVKVKGMKKWDLTEIK